MVLDIPKYLQNLISKEMKVSHFNGKVSVGKTEKLKLSFKQQIQAQYGESFLQDADYIAIFKQDDADDSSMKKLFDLVNRALGKDANNMTQSDFKVAKGDDGASETSDDVDSEDGEESPNTTKATMSFVFMKITVK